MNKPLVSVIVASYNYEDYMVQTIESVIAQSYDNWEMVIVDDGSKDKSVDVIKKFVKQDKRIKLYQHEGGINKGLPATLQLALSKSNGEWVAFCEADDYWHKDYLKKKMAYVKKYPDVAIVSNAIQLFGDENEIKRRGPINEIIEQTILKQEEPQYAFYDFYYRNALVTFSAIMVRKDVLQECDFVSPIPAWVDWWLWRQIAFKHKIGGVNEKLTYWRIHPVSYNTSKKGTKTSQRMIEGGNKLLSDRYGKDFCEWKLKHFHKFIIRFLKRKTVCLRCKKGYLRLRILGMTLLKWKHKNCNSKCWG